MVAPPAPLVQQTSGLSALTNAAPQAPPVDTQSTDSTASADDPESGGDSGEVADSGIPGTENATASANTLEREPTSPLPIDNQSDKQPEDVQAETMDNALNSPPNVDESANPSIDEANDTKESVPTAPEGAATESVQDGDEAEDPTSTPSSGLALKHKENQKRARSTEDDEEEGIQVATRITKRTRTARSKGKEAIPQPTVATQSASTTSTPTTTTDASANAHSALQSQISLVQGLEREWMRRNAMNATITINLPPCPNPALAGNPYAFTTMMFPAGRTAAPPYTAPFAPPVAAGPSTPVPIAAAPVATSSTVGTTTSAAQSASEDLVFIDVTPEYVNAWTQPGTQTPNITGPVSATILSPNKKKWTSSRNPEHYHPTPNPPWRGQQG